MTIDEILTALRARDKMTWTRDAVVNMRDAIWAERCPGYHMGEDDVIIYTRAAVAALNVLSPFRMIDEKKMSNARMRKGIG